MSQDICSAMAKVVRCCARLDLTRALKSSSMLKLNSAASTTLQGPDVTDACLVLSLVLQSFSSGWFGTSRSTRVASAENEGLHMVHISARPACEEKAMQEHSHNGGSICSIHSSIVNVPEFNAAGCKRIESPLCGNAYRECMGNGTWAFKSNYSNCEPILEEKRKYPMHYKIALIINYLGHCISVGALVVAFILFLCLRQTDKVPAFQEH
ncbi:hypothetical protein JZ751_024067 [Albula glossodonta]|uniref:Uncharacterized protein n=1 Tax=Albula glossodonta TaxID=121402 RepID=A0A8T2NNS6_9TELE|nr:hypothetical protein JZ751_024067 [Albula glossodonta]